MGDEHDVDALLAQIDAPEAPPAMEGEAAPEAAAAAEPVWNGQEWEFEWNGKKIVPESRDHIKTWMSQGYNYSQRMGELNKTHAQRMAEADAAHTKAQEIEGRFKPYSEIDQYAKSNPEWWQHVEQAWNSREKPQLDPNIDRVLSPIQEKLGRLEQFVGSIEQQKEAEKQQQLDQALEQEIGEIRKAHPNIDLAALDPETGETLELRVLKHAAKIGTQSFKAAYRDLLHDRLIEDARASGRQALTKDKEKQVKQGLLGTSQAPVKTLKPANTKAPWNAPEYDGANILKEMGIGG